MFNPDRSDFPDSYVNSLSMDLDNEIFAGEFGKIASRFGISAIQSKYNQSDCKNHDQSRKALLHLFWND